MLKPLSTPRRRGSTQDFNDARKGETTAGPPSSGPAFREAGLYHDKWTTLAPAIGYLCTGTALALLGQMVMNQV